MARNVCRFLFIQKLFLRRCMSTQKTAKAETYYEILKLDKNCSTKDIRNAYVDLSKKLHPDISGEQSKPQFLKVLEAYNVLRKPHLRTAYDHDLLSNSSRRPVGTTANGTKTTEVHRPWEIKPDYDPNPGPYYGIKGLPRVSNSRVALLLLALGILMSIVGFSSVNRSFSYHRTEIDKKSAEASSHHANVRADAEKYGNEEQIRRMANRMLNRESRST